MSTRLDSSNHLRSTLWWRNLNLQWPIGLAIAVLAPLSLPVATSPVTLAAFAVAMISLIVLARFWLIAALPVLATIGPHCLPIAAFGVSIYGFRLLLMLLALFSTPLNTRAKWWFNPVARWAIFFGAFWLFYGLLSLFWAPDRNSGLGEIVTIVFGFTLILALFSLEAYRPDHLDKLRFGWLIAFLLAAMVGWLEILTDRHLPSPRAEHNLDYFSHSKIVSTMSHTSNFGGFLLLVVPFLIWSMEKAKGPAKLAYIAMIGAVGHLMFYTASRIGLLGLIAQLAIYVVVLNRRWYTILLLALGALVAFGYWTHISSRGELAVARKVRSAELGTDASIDHRLALTLNGLYMVYKTAGRGVGAAGFEDNISGEDLLVPLPILRFGTRWNAHNFWVEILSQYGVLPFGAFMALLGWAGVLGWRAQRRPPGRLAPVVGRSLVVALVGYVFYGAAGGTAMEQPANWMFLASLIVMAAFLHDELRSKPAPWDSRPGL